MSPRSTKRGASKNGVKKTSKARTKPGAGGYRESHRTARDESASVKRRVAEIELLSIAACEHDNVFGTLIEILKNRAEPAEVRLAALRTLQAGSFSVVKFAPRRAPYLAALRAVMADPDAEIRQTVLGYLTREKDGPAQKRLLDGLEDPEKALVSPEKALQLLAYDSHSDAYPVAREIVRKPPNATAKREALRLLAADAGSTPLFEKLLRDKDESPEVRQISASALQSLKPEALQKHARAIVLDDSDDDDVRTTSLTAITQFGNEDDVGADSDLVAGVDKLKTRDAASLKQVAQRFLGKYRR